MFGRVSLVMKACFFLLQMAGIAQYDGAQIDCGRRGVNWPVESFFDQPGNPATVVKMGVRQDYGVDIPRWYGSIFPVAQPPFLGALKKTAIDEHLHARLVGRIIAGIDEVLRSGNGPGSAEELKVGHSVPFADVFREAKHLTGN